MSQKNITVEEVEYTAELARLELSAKEKKKFAGDLDNILGYFKDLSEADTSKIVKLNHYDLVDRSNGNHFRKDELRSAGNGVREGIKDNFPVKHDDLLMVKTILKKK